MTIRELLNDARVLSFHTWFIAFRRSGEPIAARCVIDQQLPLALLADIPSFEEDIDGAVEAVAVRDIRAVNPALVAELFDRERQQFLVNLETEVDLPPLDVFFRQNVTSDSDTCPSASHALIVRSSFFKLICQNSQQKPFLLKLYTAQAFGSSFPVVHNIVLRCLNYLPL